MKSEIELIELKEKLKKAEEEKDGQETYFISCIGGSITCIGLSIFIWYKKILDEYWIYAFGLFAVMAVIGLLLGTFAYKWEKEASKKVKELKKQEKELRRKIK